MGSQPTQADWHTRNQAPSSRPEDPKTVAGKRGGDVPETLLLGHGKSALRHGAWPSSRRYRYPYQVTSFTGEVLPTQRPPTRSGDPFRPTPHGPARVSGVTESVSGVPKAHIDPEVGGLGEGLDD